jgi:hypothetical protein
MTTNPFAAPKSPPFTQPPSAIPAFKPIDGIQYLRMYNYIFENPNWLMNVLLTALCNLIPVIGPLVLMGYQYEIAISLLMTGGQRYPDFDFGRFADYLMRGLWPFLVYLVASLVIAPLIILLCVVPFFLLMGIGANAGDNAGPIILLVGFPLLILFSVLVSIIPAIFLLPMLLKAGLQQDFAAAFDFGWVMSFVKKTWSEMLLGLLFLACTALVLMLLGYLACIVGAFASIAIIYLAQAHFLYQLYLLFLSRGGQAVPIKLAPGPQHR